jgi:tRNA pseudouridine38-40 synthase
VAPRRASLASPLAPRPSPLVSPTYRIDLAYDGTGFRGWARNPGVRTVQGVLEDALEAALGVPVATSVAGRTDAGVHARHQVASFSADQPVAADRLRRSLDGLCGPEISILGVAPAPDGFDARFSAVSRSYRYLIDERVACDPLQRHRVWHLGEPLTLDAMNVASSGFVGDHDFASLCRASDGRSLERRVLDAGWERVDDLLVFGVVATSFCHQMVRSMVALCVDVGRGRVHADAVPGILEARDRHAARGVAPPHGLTLWEVGY